jgi:hypothetical protein
MNIFDNYIIWSNQIDAVFRENGISLFDNNIKNWAFTKKEALNVINQLAILRIPILGGDVLTKQGCKWEYNYDNWYSEEKDTPQGESFLEHSIKKAKAYIINYKTIDDNAIEIFFTIVPRIKSR